MRDPEEEMLNETNSNQETGIAAGLQAQLMGRLSAAILAKAFLPSPAHIKKSLHLVDLGIKI